MSRIMISMAASRAPKGKAASSKAKPKKLPLPAGVIALQEWQSASYRLDDDLAENLKKAGIILTWFSSPKISSDYTCLAISKKKLSQKVIDGLAENVLRHWGQYDEDDDDDDYDD